MNINFNKIIKIKNNKQLTKYMNEINKNIDEPIFNNNYIFHYMILLNNLDGLKITKYPVYIVNDDNLNCFHLAAKTNNIDILIYLLKTYTDYIYNININGESFLNYLDLSNIIYIIKKFPKLKWNDLIFNDISNKYEYQHQLYQNILINLNYKEYVYFKKHFTTNINKFDNNYIFYKNIIYNNILNINEKIKLLNKYSINELNIKDYNNSGLLMDTIKINNNILFDYLLERK